MELTPDELEKIKSFLQKARADLEQRLSDFQDSYPELSFDFDEVAFCSRDWSRTFYRFYPASGIKHEATNLYGTEPACRDLLEKISTRIP